ncbi:phosphatidylinositol alpha-1,6-mannosyltransferase [Streptosporangium becharense]|uniref:Phosphatidylinositol alpha-1,6-mannosyltransferase n=1 Tax=Streptosporangium becharense TaxID=1816182 RepID=A0A7W9MFF0_9ACTN|nr:glycosyltransferase family 4 protein [Streptosporangium becharense]MBB2911879.1 phosphatidylinositol alpha-1,6-mannosyltransferase [Streptosporangium becharense]MBB5818426.1 phosphatidylinositol alpha-1,6-mannosyltransferase [Streptosporangium becharense]
MKRTLVVTNDFPPRTGGIQSFVHGLVSRLPPDSVVVYAPDWPGCADFDLRQPYPVVRHPTSLMLPTPAVARRAAGLIAEFGCDTVVFGAAAPLGLLAPRVRAAGADRVVMVTHGHEAAWAGFPAGRRLLARIGAHADVVTYLGEYTRRRLAGAIPEGRLVRLAPGVDTAVFHPGADGARVRAVLGLGERPVVVCLSRLVPRKGQDTLLRAWPAVLRDVPRAVLLIVGGGPYRRKLERLARPLGGSVRMTGPVPEAELPGHLAAGDVFAMPCRTRLGGADVEGLGIVYLEASASGLPVVAGASGGAPDAVRHGETGLVVDGRSPREVAAALSGLLRDPVRARAMGERGREWVAREWSWDLVASRFAGLLEPA